MDSFSDVIGLWDNAEQLAKDIGEKGVTVRQWRNRGNIPSRYWPAIISAAASRDFLGVTLELMFALSQKRRAA